MGRHLRSDPRVAELETLYREQHRRVRWVLRGRGVTDDVLDDLVHEAFLAIFRRLPERDPAVPLTSWVSGVARNVAFSHRRSSARRVAAVQALPEPPDAEQPDETVARRHAWMQLDEFLSGLDAEQREVFVLAELLGMRVVEVADVVDAPLNTLYSRLRIARQRFAARFGDDHAEQLRRAGQGECPTRAQRRHAWMLLSTELFGAAPVAAATATTSVGLKWLLAGGVAVGVAGVAAVAVQRNQPAATVRRSSSPTEPAADAAPATVTASPVPPTRPAVTPAVAPSVAPAVAPSVVPSKIVAPTRGVPIAAPPTRQRTAPAAATPQPEPSPTPDPLSETVETLRNAQRQLREGDPEGALATVDALGARAHGPMRPELHRIERQAACDMGKTERATRARDALVARGALRAGEPVCEEKVAPP
ncbi:MAG: sigma-70 family RNA polymerase sigma factor [Myxococcota bacterium]